MRDHRRNFVRHGGRLACRHQPGVFDRRGHCGARRRDDLVYPIGNEGESSSSTRAEAAIMTDPRTPQPQVDLPQGTLLRANCASAAVAAAIGFLGALAIGQGRRHSRRNRSWRRYHRGRCGGRDHAAAAPPPTTNFDLGLAADCARNWTLDGVRRALPVAILRGSIAGGPAADRHASDPCNRAVYRDSNRRQSLQASDPHSDHQRTGRLTNQ